MDNITGRTNIINVSNQDVDIRSNNINTKNEDINYVSNSILSLKEAKKIVESLVCFRVEDIGSTTFLEMYGCSIERLALQAHASASQISNNSDGVNEESNTRDEFVIELIIFYNKLDVLIRTLLAVETWRMYVLKNIGNDDTTKEAIINKQEVVPTEKDNNNDGLAVYLAKRGNILRCAFTLHVETTLISLISLVLFQRKAVEEMEDETVIALIDYCARNMVLLATPVAMNPVVQRQKEPFLNSVELSEYMHNRTPLQEIEDTILHTEFQNAVCSISVARYLCEHIESLSLAAQSRILDTHDFLIVVVPLVDEPPWTRRRRRLSPTTNDEQPYIWEKFIHNSWQQIINKQDLLQVTQLEAQCWIIVFYLTCARCCRERYALNTFRKDQLLRLRKFLNEWIVDQLPFLTDVMRYMDELAIMSVPDYSSPFTDNNSGCFFLQQVPILRDSFIRGKDWNEVIQYQMSHVFCQEGSNVESDNVEDDILRRISDIYTMDGIEHILTGNYPPSSSTLDHNDDGNDDLKQLQLHNKPTSVSLSIITTRDNNNSSKTIVNQIQFDIDYDSAKQVDNHNTNNGHQQQKQRMKLIVSSQSNPKMDLRIFSNCSLEVHTTSTTSLSTDDDDDTKQFHKANSQNESNLLVLENVNLPVFTKGSTNNSSSDNASTTNLKVPDTLPATVWKQIGSSSKDNFVVQLGFKRLNFGSVNDADDEIVCYRLQSAFISLPLLLPVS